MVALHSVLRTSTVFLALDAALASRQTLVRRAIDGLHLEASRRTHSLAKDLRVAFGGIFPRAVSSSQQGHVVYCKPARQVPLSPGSSGGSEYNHTSTSMSIIGTRTRTPTSHPTKASTSLSPTATSPWKLIDSHVRVPLNNSQIRKFIQFCRVGQIFSMVGISTLVRIRRMVRDHFSGLSMSPFLMVALFRNRGLH
jgi:hypothetical protein